MYSKKDLYYTKSHEWVSIKDGYAVCGITDYAQNSMGDIVYIEFPEVDEFYETGEECAVVESVKAASDIYCPLSGVVTEVNELLEDSPEDVNSAPYESWLFKIELDDNYEKDLDKLMDYVDYEDFLAEEE